MRNLASNERRLLVVFLAAVFVAGNLFVVRFWLDKRRETVRSMVADKSKLAEYTSLSSAADLIGQASQWIASNPPPEFSADEANTRLLGEVRSAAEAAGLTIVEETLMPADGSGTAALQTKVSGPFAGLAAFLFGLQSPDAWRSIDRIAIRSDKEPQNVVAEIVVKQHYNERQSTP